MSQEVFLSIGKRIAEERKRMGLSQSAFADLVGVSFSSQRRYERGDRSPDTGYLNALHSIGVDVLYVLDRTVQPWMEDAMKGAEDDFKVGKDVGWLLLDVLGITSEEWVHIVNQSVKRAWNGAPMFMSDSPSWRDGIVKASRLISSLTKAAATLDSSLLTEVLTGLDQALSDKQQPMSPPKKAQVATMLYRAFKASGKIDPAMIEEAVTLAAG